MELGKEEEGDFISLSFFVLDFKGVEGAPGDHTRAPPPTHLVRAKPGTRGGGGLGRESRSFWEETILFICVTDCVFHNLRLYLF